MPATTKRARIRPHDAEAIARLRQTARTEERTGCLLWTGPLSRRGYGSVGYRSKRWTPHRLSYFAHYGPIPEGMLVCHKCDVRNCIAIEHLFLGTPQDNTTDMLRKGRGRWRSRLTVKQVVAIKRRLLRGDRCRDIAPDFGLSVGGIMSIKHGKSWSHVRLPGEKARAIRKPYDDRIPILEFDACSVRE